MQSRVRVSHALARGGVKNVWDPLLHLHLYTTLVHGIFASRICNIGHVGSDDQCFVAHYELRGCSSTAGQMLTAFLEVMTSSHQHEEEQL